MEINRGHDGRHQQVRILIKEPVGLANEVERQNSDTASRRPDDLLLAQKECGKERRVR